MVDSIEQRVLELIKKCINGVEEVTRTTKELVHKQHAYEYEWDEWEDVERTEEDYTKREQAFEELLKLGRTAIPTLVKIVTAEKGEYPEEFLGYDSGVASALRTLADAEVSKTLVKPFQEKLQKDSEETLYKEQITIITNIWKRHPLPETTHILYDAITKKKDKKHAFDKYQRDNFLDALLKIGTKEAIQEILTIIKEDIHSKHEFNSNYALAKQKLQKNREEKGSILYDIYRTTDDMQIKEITSELLGWRKAIYWLNKKLHQ